MVENTRNEECFIREEKNPKYVVHDIYEKGVIVSMKNIYN